MLSKLKKRINVAEYNIAYLINRIDDPVLKHLTDSEIEKMCIGRMPARCIDGINRYISIGDKNVLEQLRSKYFYKHNNGLYYKRKN